MRYEVVLIPIRLLLLEYMMDERYLTGLFPFINTWALGSD